MKWLAMFALSVSLLIMPQACIKSPPNLSPVGVSAFNNTRVIKVLDMVRDIAQDANAQVPPLVSEDLARKITEWHRSALVLIDSGPGWQTKVRVGLEEIVKDLPPKESAVLSPYVTLVQTLLKSVAP